MHWSHPLAAAIVVALLPSCSGRETERSNANSNTFTLASGFDPGKQDLLGTVAGRTFRTKASDYLTMP